MSDLGLLRRLYGAAGPGLIVDTGGHGLTDLGWSIAPAADSTVGLTLPVEQEPDGLDLQLSQDAAGFFEALRDDRLSEWAAANPAGIVPTGR